MLIKIGLLLVCMFIGGLSASVASDSQIVAGAGPSTGIVKAFFNAFSKMPDAAGTSFTIMESSVKHSGGLKNSDIYLFGRSGRPLNDEEKKSGKREIFLGRVEIGFATGLEAGVKALSIPKLKDIYTRKIKNWKELGGPDAPIVLLGREANESVLSELKEEYPWFREVAFDQVFKKDDELLKYLVSPLGRHALAFGTKSQFAESQQLNVTDFHSGLKVGLIYDQKNEGHVLVKAAKKYSTGKEWRALVVKEGFLPL